MHSGRPAALCIVLLAAGLLAAACAAAPTPGPTPAIPTAAATLPPATATPTPGPLTVTVIADGQTRRFALPEPLTVNELLAQAGLTVGEFDRLDPPPFTRLADGAVVTLVRVRQTFEIEQVVVPFESQTLKNENLPADSAPLILQPGENGLEEVTYRVVFEDGVQVSRSPIRRVPLKPAVPQIVMVGIQRPFTAAPISGTLTYLSGGNAWLMRGNSSQRTPLTTSGDLDGRVFDLAPDSGWLLVSRAVTESATTFNALYALSLTAASAISTPVSLPVTNTLYAEWSPTQTVTLTVAYSTADKTAGALGWQARNDLWLLNWSEDRRTRRPVFTFDEILPPSFSGAYAWWGTGFAFAPDGLWLAYAQTDSVGVVDLATREKVELARFTAYNLQSDTRAWYPTLRWAEGGWLYTLVHGGPLDQFELPEFSTVFNLVAIAPDSRLQLDLVPRAGMFANPVPSPAGSAATGERPARVAFLLATDPKNPLLTPYRLAVMDRDGSNLRVVFPPEGQPGIEPGVVPAWSPDGRLIALIYQGNLWLLDPGSGESQQLTGDGLTTRVEWGR